MAVEAALRQPQAIGETLLGFYRAAAARAMRGLPVYNDALDFAAIGFCAHGERALGIIVTPWFMNLVLAPLDAAEIIAAPGATVSRTLPAGSFAFTTAAIDGFGGIESCSLFSPMFEFADHAAAVAAAQAALSAVLDPQFGAEPAAAPAAIDRRRFLRGSVSGAKP